MWLVTLLIGLSLSTAAQSESGQSISPSAPLVSTRQTLFSIPFRLDPPADPSQQAVEVHLFVSHDKGAHWQQYARANPNQKQIPFRTASDGEFWFAIRTLDQAKRLHPEKITLPGLRVIVDTTPPKMQLSSQCGQAGQINVQWQINENHPKPESLSIQYRLSPDGPWQAVALSENNYSINDNIEKGEVSWWPQPGSKEVQIRAEISDSAGNKSVSHMQVKIDADTAPKPNLAGTGNNNSEKTERTVDRPFTTDSQSSGLSLGINPPIANRYQSSNETTTDPELRLLPSGERPRMINTRLFELDYDLESVGPSGISRVELWGTRDGGRSWRLFAVDDDNRSPISVSVDDDGIYGFRIVATSGAGLAEQPPKNGELPAIWVGVDLSKPNARIVSAEVSKNSDESKLTVCWEASDKMLADRPITLSFSANPNGPWTTIATGLENTGRYNWSIDSNVPPLIYIRLEARDEAGNLAVYDRKEPVALDQKRPSAKIREVRPVAKTSYMQPKLYIFR